MFDIGTGELLLIVIFVLVFFGPKKLPELAQSMGRGMREFRKAQQEFSNHINSAFEDEQRKAASGPPAPQPNTMPRNRLSSETIAESSEIPPAADGGLPPGAGMIAPPPGGENDTPKET
jgi:TatA/E family protein of Tat protein translocase